MSACKTSSHVSMILRIRAETTESPAIRTIFEKGGNSSGGEDGRDTEPLSEDNGSSEEDSGEGVPAEDDRGATVRRRKSLIMKIYAILRQGIKLVILDRDCHP